MRDETECLREYAATGSEDAFSELVRRALPMVYAAALRQVGGDEGLAKDVAQTVFIDLARKAKGLVGRELLAGWLYTSTRYAAASARRSAQRRQSREQEAVAMQETTLPPAPDHSAGDWKAVLDDALGALPVADRNAVLLRFFQDKGLREVGAALGISEDAARMRVNRALEKLHSVLSARGVTLSATALAGLLSAEAVSAVPAGLAASITGTALASVGGAGLSFSTILKSMAMTKLKIGMVGVVLAAGVAVPWYMQHQALTRLREENQSLRHFAAQAAELSAQNEQLSNRLALAADTQGLSSEQRRDLLRLRNEVGTLRRQTNELRQLQAAARQQKDAGDSSSTNAAVWVPRSEWTFAGYATPEATLQTTWWALSNGDTNTLLAALHPEVRKQLEAQPEALARMLSRRDYAEIPGFRIVSKLGAPGEMLFTVDYLTHESDPNPGSSNHCLKVVALRQCEDGWRFCGSKDLK